MLPFDPQVLVVALKAYLALCVVCTIAIFTLFALEERFHNRQLCRQRERRARTDAAVRARRIHLAESRRVIGGSGGRR
jgi:hypothetical protein